MYLIVSKRGKQIYFRSDKDIAFVSGFVNIPTNELLDRLEDYPVFQVSTVGAAHTIVDVDKCSLNYSGKHIIVSGLDQKSSCPEKVSVYPVTCDLTVTLPSPAQTLDEFIEE